MKKLWMLVPMIAFCFACTGQQNKMPMEQQTQESEKVIKTIRPDEEWKKILTPQQYHVLREKGTEHPFTSDLLEVKKEGIYKCAACGNPLFTSETKFKSGTGWPSFYEPASDTSVIEQPDPTLGVSLTEVLCAQCEGHLGHVFDDGPEPTGLRYCINGVALQFDPK